MASPFGTTHDAYIAECETAQPGFQQRIERAFVIESAIASQALSGVHIGREEAERLYDEQRGRALPDVLEEEH